MSTPQELIALAKTLNARPVDSAVLQCVRTLVLSAPHVSTVPQSIRENVVCLCDLQHGSSVAWAATCLSARWKRQLDEAAARFVPTLRSAAYDMFERALMREERGPRDIFAATPAAIAVRLANELKSVERTDDAYRVHARMLFLNIADADSDVRKMLLTGECTPDDVCRMTRVQLLPSKTRKRDADTAALRMKLVRKTTGLEDTPPGPFKCKNCGCNRIADTQLQTRGADEPITTFLTCSECGKRWRS